VHHSGEEYQAEKKSTGFIIKVQRKERNEDELRALVLPKHCVHCHERRKQKQKESAAKDQRFFRIIGEQVDDLMDIDLRHTCYSFSLSLQIEVFLATHSRPA